MADKGKLRLVPVGERKCVWMEAGVVAYKLCNQNYNCTACAFDQAMSRRVAAEEPAEATVSAEEKANREVPSWMTKFRDLPAEQRKCRYMLSGDVPFKLCPNNFQCGECAYDQMVSDRQLGPPPIEYEKVSKVSGFYLPEGLHFHRAHTWARIEGGGRIRVGLDDFGRRLIGKTDAVELPPLGRELKQGETGWRLRRGNRLLGAISPIDGTVVAVNRKLEKDPSIAHEDPYGEGWAFIVEPKNLTRNIRNLLYGDMTREWYSEDAHRLLKRIGTELGQTIPDGGLPVEDLYEDVDEDTWGQIVKEFLFS